MSCVEMSTIRLHQDYLDLPAPKETVGVGKLYMRILKDASVAFLRGELEKFDATIGDHACQVPARFVIGAYLNDEVKAEAEKLKEIASVYLKGSSEDIPEIFISKSMDYLVRAYFLYLGRELSVSRDGTISLRVHASKIGDKASKACSRELIGRLIIVAKQKMNQFSLLFVQELAKEVLPRIEADCFLETVQRDEAKKLQFSCSFFNVKAIFSSLLDKGIPFAIAVFGKKEAPLFLDKVPEKGSPFCLIKGFPPEGGSIEVAAAQIRDYGLMEFALANIAVYPQFLDMKEEEYRENQDLVSLPSERQSEIIAYRKRGKSAQAIFKIAHIHAETV